MAVPAHSGGVATLHHQWLNSHLAVRNTFLDLSPPLAESATGFRLLRRKTSEPTLASFAMVDEASREALFAEAEQLRKLDQIYTESASPTATTRTRSSTSTSASDEALAASVEKVSEELMTVSMDCPLEMVICSSADAAELDDDNMYDLDDENAEAPVQQGKKKSMRPCKGKRDRYRRAFERFSGLVACGASPEGLELPSWLEQNKELKNKFMTRLAKVLEERVAATLPLPEPPALEVEAGRWPQPHPQPRMQPQRYVMMGFRTAQPGYQMDAPHIEPL